MIGYVTLGTNDLARSAAFYDGIAAILGQGRVFETERSIGWGGADSAMLSVIMPLDGMSATGGNGSMFGLPVEHEEQVQQIHDFALAHGGRDEGLPGPRGEHFYGGYFRDPDGNKLVAYLFRG